jgi:hypothetical protein
MDAMNLPPVPESLRQLARQQLDVQQQAFKLRSLRRIMRDLAGDARRMQEVIIQRTKRPGTIEGVDGGWSNNAGWSLLLSDFDKAVFALRAAWQELKNTEPALLHVFRTWRQENNIPPDLPLTDESEEYWAILSPLLEDARRNSNPLIDAAISTWIATTTRYCEMLRHTQEAPVFGPQLPVIKGRYRILEQGEPLPNAA